MADKVVIRRVQDGDMKHVAELMRLEDALECALIANLTPTEALDLSIHRAVACWTVELDGEPVAIFGINRRSQTSDVGVPWLLGTDRLCDMRATFAKTSVAYRDRFKRAFPKMENYIHVDNKASIDWLRWLGFAMDEPEPRGFAGEPFIRFHMGMS